MAADTSTATEIVADVVGLDGVAGYLDEVITRARALPDLDMHSFQFRVGGMTVSTRFSDRERALLYASRLPRADDQPDGGPTDLNVDIIETAHLGWPAPLRPRVPNGDRKAFDQVLEESGLRAVPPSSSRLWDVMDREGRYAVQLSRSAADYPEWDAGAPLRIPLHWAALARGMRLIHGATLGNDRASILMTGPGGAGKSGTTLAGIASGLQTVGDDYVLLEAADQPMAWQAYRILKQDEAGLARLPGLSDRLIDRRINWQGKLELDPEALFPGCLTERQAIHAIVIPEINWASRSKIEPIGQARAFGALVRSTLQQFPDEQASGFLFCQRLVRSLPCYRLSLSPNANEVAATVQNFLEGLGE